MREIKFRAWWIKEAKMLHEVHDFYDTLGDAQHGNDEEPECSFGEVLDKPDKYIVMQYTGLKDKNGKEIYEGDVVQYNIMRGGFEPEYKREVVAWAGHEPENHGDSYFTGYRFTQELITAMYEVIGNIYENPELIK